MQDRRAALRDAAVVSLLTLFGLAVHGYHPYVEDGGIYVAGVRKLVDPSLYPTWTAFVTEHIRFSAYAPLTAGIVRGTHLPLEYVLFGLYLAGIWSMLGATWMLVRRVVEAPAARYGAVMLMACWLTLPVAGTALLLMDPYVTARSFSTPLVLAAMAWALDRRATSWGLCSLALMVACVLHPLMGGYGVAAVLVLTCAKTERRTDRNGRLILLAMLALGAAGVLQALSPVESTTAAQAVASRVYWFPLEWEWYEQVGLVAPVLLLLALKRGHEGRSWRVITRAALALWWICVLVAACFSHQTFSRHLVARLQPLRCLQIVYEVMIVLLGAWLGERVLKTHAWRWAVMTFTLGASMWLGQWNTFPNSGHIEWPWAQPVNPWEQAFVWIRENTPKNALFGLDAHYIEHGKHEDAQCFRAVAERSVLPDYSKDGGEASITTSLTGPWILGQQAQTGLEQANDAERLRRLQPLGVTWAVLEATSGTRWDCPYRNRTVKVCRLP